MNKGHEAFWGSGSQVGDYDGRDGEGVAGKERGAPEGVGQLEYWNNGTKDGDREMKREIMTDEEILLEAMEKRITELQVATEILRDLQNRNAWGYGREEELAACERRIIGLQRCAQRLKERCGSSAAASSAPAQAGG